jgi:isochorismate hydrolase
MNTLREENEFRAVRITCAATAVDAYLDNIEEPANLAADILADLRHFCDLHGLSFAEMNERGEAAYCEETQETTE